MPHYEHGICGSRNLRPSLPFSSLAKRRVETNDQTQDRRRGTILLLCVVVSFVNSGT